MIQIDDNDTPIEVAQKIINGTADYAHINNVDDCVDCVRYADTIIEADKEDGV